MLNAQIIALENIEIHPLACRARAPLVKKFGEEHHNKRFPPHEWQRISLAFEKIRPGVRCLEVGPGRGYLSNMLAWEKKFQNQVALDIVELKNPKKFDPHIQYIQKSVTELDEPDGYYDTVICMEVLEHLEDGDFKKALQNIRRVCKSHLIMSVPFLEPLPLPPYHKQQFDAERIRKTFPDGKISLLMKNPARKVPWMMIEEFFEQPVAA